MGINRRVKLKWEGKEVSAKIPLDAIERIEEEVDLAALTVDFYSNRGKFAKFSKLLSAVLHEAGVEVSASQIHDEMLLGEGVDVKDVRLMVGEILNNIFPQPKKKSS